MYIFVQVLREAFLKKSTELCFFNQIWGQGVYARPLKIKLVLWNVHNIHNMFMISLQRESKVPYIFWNASLEHIWQFL